MKTIEQLEAWFDAHAPFTNIVLAIILLIVTLTLRRYLVRLILRVIRRHKADNPDSQTNLNFLKHFLSAVILVIAIGFAVGAIPQLRAVAAGLLAGAGVVALVIGFAAQTAFSNLVEGVLIIIYKPFRVGDPIEVQGHYGWVEDITLRHTVIRNIENKRFVIPNSIIAKETILNANIADEIVLLQYMMGVSYDSDLVKTQEIMTRLAEECPYTIDNRTEEEKANNDPVATTIIHSYGDSAINVRVTATTKNNADAWDARIWMNARLKAEFDQAGISIPFPHRQLVLTEQDRNALRHDTSAA